MAKFIYSTLTSGQAYTTYKKGGGDLPIRDATVHIDGGSNVADKHFMTKIGVLTQITDAQYEAIKDNYDFKLHCENGFIKVLDAKYDPENIAADQETRDESAPLVDADFKDKPPVVNSNDKK